MELNRKFRKLLNAQLRDMTVEDIMAPEVVTINEDATFAQLYSLISEYHHVGYPVVNKENETTGVISYKDLFRVTREDWSNIRVKERMSTRLVCVSPGDDVIDAMEKMTEEGIGRLLVMEEDKLVGIVSRSSVMDGAIKRLLA
ncbi:Inosine-5'-monophosphate dehydrogenase [ANME-1 cluster archaeon GoMg2]|nr:Inosine-5'-monophosphate dehydrogenase [ANME-1 cluster archaeon GoMg2]